MKTDGEGGGKTGNKSKSKTIRILLIEKSRSFTRLIQEMIAEAEATNSANFTHDLVHAERLSTGLKRLAKGGIDLILLDLSLPDSEGLVTLNKVYSRAPEVAIVVLTTLYDEDLAVAALQEGAYDYLVKSEVDSKLLVRSINYVIMRQRMHMQLLQYTREIQSHEARIRNILENNTDSIVVVDKDGIVLFANPAAEAFFDRKAEELIGELFGFPIVAGETTEVEIIHYGERPRTGEIRVAETEWEGKPVCLASIRDITERKEAEEALAASKAYTESIIQNFLDTLIVVDAEAKIQTVNPATCYLLGYTEEELIGQPISMIFAEEEEEEEEVHRVFQFFREPEKAESLRSQDTIRNRELTYKTRDGRLIPMSFNASVLTDEVGNVTEVVAGAKDITELKLAETEIRKEKRFSENIVATVPESLLVVDKHLRIKSANRTFYETFQIVPEKTIGTRITDILGDGDGRLSTELTRLFGTKDVQEKLELHYQSENLGERIFNVTARGILVEEEEEEEEELIVLEDITKKKEIDRVKSELISNVSHELRTPISIVKEGVSLVLDGVLGPIKEDQKDILSRVKNNIDRLARLINDLLDISKIEAGRMVLKKSLVDISSLAKEILISFKNQAEEKNIKLITHLNVESPDISIDSDRISQVLTNLISNSIKFTPENGQITLGVEDRKDKVEISVEDTGIGIAEENIPDLFERFSQFDRTDGPGQKGTGLGLAISKEIVEMHKGKIWVESEPGKGSKFTFSLPRLSQEEIFREYLIAGIKEAEEKGGSLCLVIIHIKNFKELEKKHGSSESLLIVQEIEGVVRRTLRRKSDIVSRYQNGDIIITILMDTPKKHAPSVKGRIKQALDAEIRQIERLKDVLIFLDEVTYPADAASEEELIDRIKKGHRV